MIRTPQDPELHELAQQLRAMSEKQIDAWPEEQLGLCGEAGFYKWFISEADGGFGWSSSDIARGYFELSSACLTTTFILTQRVAALKRIAGCQNKALRQSILPNFANGKTTATVGISHLTTSRRHLAKPVLTATPVGDDTFEINGTCPWVTGGAGADFVLMGADVINEAGDSTEDQILFLVDSADAALNIKDGFQLVALSDSQTGAVGCSFRFANRRCCLRSRSR